jgi:hypothetical protein
VLRRCSIYDGTIQTFLKGLDVHSDNGVEVIVSDGMIDAAVLLLPPPITVPILLLLLTPLHLLRLRSSTLSIGSITRASTNVCRLRRWNIVGAVKRGGLR